MIRRTPTLAVGVAAALAATGLAAQHTDTSLDQFRTPASPVFVLLGVAPSAAERPTTPKALATTVLSAGGGLQSFLKNYAVEVAPYWLSSHPGLTYAKFQHPGILRSLTQNLSFSVATSSSSTLISDSGTAVGFGARTLISVGNADTAEWNALVVQLDNVQQRQNLVLLRVVRPGHDSASLRERDSLETVNDSLTRQLQKFIQDRKDRIGLIVEAAAGVVATYSRNVFDKGTISRVGAWVTPTYRIAHPQLDVLVVTRFIRDVSADHSVIDVGGRFVYTNRGLAISGEYVGRFGSSSVVRSHRASGNLEYRWAEGKFVTASFGKDFAAPGGKTLIALIGVDLGFGQVPVLSLKR